MDTTTTTILAVLGTYFVILIIIAVLWVIANWKIFSKAGYAGWKSIIPFYNGYILYKFTWKAPMFFIMLACSIIGSITAQMGSGVWLAIALAFSIAGAVIAIIQYHKQSLAFGHGIGFTFGLIFLNTIFVLILAFGKSEYKGNPCQANGVVQDNPAGDTYVSAAPKPIEEAKPDADADKAENDQ